ncbi:hypothetical protein SEUCBS139899_006107 [Sporothrix eucalyptigena]|uniref:Uncharacterized protein n=1 Tax=Sporothrix eucalyptigena TaxID=1812306 RepID=A0ABP0CA41_9PEZI
MSQPQPSCLGWSLTANVLFIGPQDGAPGRLTTYVPSNEAMPIWTKALNTTPRAFAFPSTKGFSINVQVSIPAWIDRSVCTVHAQASSVPQGVVVSPSASDFRGGDGTYYTVDFSFDINRTSPAAQPWSLRQDIQFELLNGPGTEPIPIPESVSIEAYGIYETQPAFFTNEGIPRELLRLFVPPSLTTGITTEQQWIQWVTHVCHGKQDPAAAPGTLRKDSKQHWLRYQVWSGQPSFIGETGHNFKLDAWLAAYAGFQANRAWLTTVNCFDQAGIVETALSLGMSNKRLHWEIRRPFGYINADLVGWGPTNNPFFEADLSLLVLEDPLDDRRTPFRSHVFISISPTDVEADEDTAVVVDACAGPIAGDRTISDYMAHCALHDGPPLLMSGSGTVTKSLDGVNGSTASDKPGTSADAHTLSKLLIDEYGGSPQDLRDTLAGIEQSFAGTAVSAPFDVSAYIHAIVDPILANTDKDKGLVLNADTRIAKDLPTVPDTTAHSVTDEFQAIGIIGNDSLEDPTYISFRVSVFDADGADGATHAVNALRARLALLALPSAWQGADSKINVKDEYGDVNKPKQVIQDSRIRVFGNIHLSLFVYKNLLVSVSGNAVKAYIPTWTASMANRLALYN